MTNPKNEFEEGAKAGCLACHTVMTPPPPVDGKLGWVVISAMAYTLVLGHDEAIKRLCPLHRASFDEFVKMRRYAETALEIR